MVSISYFLEGKKREFYTIVGARIRLVREKNNLTQSALAKKLGISQNLLSRIERAEVETDYGVIFQLSRTFKVAIEYFSPSTVTKNRESRNV